MSLEIKCENKAAYRFTWPANDESFICHDHATKLRGLANAMSMPLQMIPLAESELGGETCRQISEASR